MAVFDKPFLNRSAVCTSAIADIAVILIPIDKATSDGPRSRQKIIQCLRGLTPTRIRPPTCILAGLLPFRGIYAVEANTLAGNLDCVAIDY